MPWFTFASNETAWAPWRGRSPLRNAGLTGDVAAALEAHLARAAETPPWALIPLPGMAVQPEADTLKARMGEADTPGPPVLTPRTTADGWDGDAGGRPQRDFDPRYLRFSPTAEAVELRRDVEFSLARAYGIGPAMLHPSSTGTGMREAARQLDAMTLAPIAKLAAVELSRALEVDIRLDLAELRAADASWGAGGHPPAVDGRFDAGTQVVGVACRGLVLALVEHEIRRRAKGRRPARSSGPATRS